MIDQGDSYSQRFNFRKMAQGQPRHCAQGSELIHA